MKDFTTDDKPDLEFQIKRQGDTRKAQELDPEAEDIYDVFYAVGDTPGGVVLDLAEMAEAEAGQGKVKAITEFLDAVLLPESAELFAERMRDQENPIKFPQLISIFEWLLEEYMGGEESARPTQVRSSSSSTRRPTGRSSTGSARSRASTPVEVLSDAL